METRAHYVAVGAFVLAMITLAFAAVLWLARSEFTTQLANYDIYFTGPVTGLRVGATVEYTGVPVGKVTDIQIVPFQKKFSEDEEGTEPPAADKTPASMIRVTVELEAKVEIKQDARASIETNILSGVSYILIERGTLAAPPLMPKPGERYAVIQAHRSRLGKVVAGAPQIVERVLEVLENVNQLLNEKNLASIGMTIENARELTSSLNERSKELSELVRAGTTLVGNVDKSYSDPDGIGERLTNAIADFDKIAKNLNDTNHQLQLAVQDARPGIRTFSQQTLSDVGSLVGEVRQLVSGLSRLTAQIERDPTRILFGDRREGYSPK